MEINYKERLYSKDCYVLINGKIKGKTSWDEKIGASVYKETFRSTVTVDENVEITSLELREQGTGRLIGFRAIPHKILMTPHDTFTVTWSLTVGPEGITL